MGGWFRKELKTPADWKGLKFRIGGFAGKVIEKMGGVPQLLPGGDIYPALEKGTIDAAEWVGPYDDEKLGLQQDREVLLLPGLVGRRSAARLLLQRGRVGQASEGLPEHRRGGVRGGQHLDARQVRRGEPGGPEAPRRRRHVAPRILEGCHGGFVQGGARGLHETSEKSPAFKKIYESMVKFREDQLLWFRVAEKGYDDFMHTIQNIK